MNGADALLQSVRDGDVSVVKRLLSGDPRLVRATDHHLKTPLHWAATMGSTKVADMLLARGAQGMNLVAAASLGKLDLVCKFLDSGTPFASLARRAVPAEPNDHWVADSACMKGDVISDAFYGA